MTAPRASTVEVVVCQHGTTTLRLLDAAGLLIAVQPMVGHA